MTKFNFTEKQKQKIRQYPQKLNYFCPRCMKAYQRKENPVSEESANCPDCGSEMHFVEYKGELIDVFWCEECEKAFLAEDEELKKIEKYEKKRKQPSSKQVSKAMEETE